MHHNACSLAYDIWATAYEHGQGRGRCAAAAARTACFCRAVNSDHHFRNGMAANASANI